MDKLLADVHVAQVVSTVTYALLGIGVFGLAYAIIERISPFSVKKEIIDDHNVAMGIIVGCVMIGLALIISAAIMTD